MQFTGSMHGQRAASPSPTSGSTSVSRRTSLARSHTLYDEVRRRAGELEPKFDAVRAKAESKITNRGYVTRRGKGEQGEPLVDLDDEGGGSGADGDMDWREWERDDNQTRRYRQTSPTRGLDVDRDTPTHDPSSGGTQPVLTPHHPPLARFCCTKPLALWDLEKSITSSNTTLLHLPSRRITMGITTDTTSSTSHRLNLRWCTSSVLKSARTTAVELLAAHAVPGVQQHSAAAHA
ncbi:hypothetical protein FRC07_011729 [Ceratobasidium sp. 392]|nr:hypothetical protein FRC07_011729 [Ceratobasidium sp. 392]